MQSPTTNVTEHPSNNYGITIDNVTSSTIDAMSRYTFMEEVKNIITYNIAIFIMKYWFPILVPIGLVGNTLSFLIMIKPSNRKMSTCIYMAAISMNDNAVMLLAGHRWLASVIQFYKRNQTECSLKPYLVKTASLNSTFQVLAMTMDKYIAIKWPHKAATYSTPKRAKLVITMLFILASIYNISNIFGVKIIESRCIPYSTESILGKLHSWLTFVIEGIIPFTMLIYMNCVIVNEVRKSQKKFAKDKKKATNKGSRHKSMTNQLTTMLLLVTTLFLMLHLPSHLRSIYQTFTKRDTPSKYASSMLFVEIAFELYTTNSGINFFLYCISGQKFRNDLKEILCCVGTGRRRSKRSEMGSSTIS